MNDSWTLTRILKMRSQCKWVLVMCHTAIVFFMITSFWSQSEFIRSSIDNAENIAKTRHQFQVALLEAQEHASALFQTNLAHNFFKLQEKSDHFQSYCRKSLQSNWNHAFFIIVGLTVFAFAVSLLEEHGFKAWASLQTPQSAKPPSSEADS
jgi:hypothetical protein